jgi:hypothetical protein
VTIDPGFDLEQRGDPLQRFLGDGRAGRGVHVEQLSAAVRPACDLDERRRATDSELVEAVEAGISIGVQEAATTLEQRARVRALAVRRVEVADRRRCRASPGALVPDQHP